VGLLPTPFPAVQLYRWPSRLSGVRVHPAIWGWLSSIPPTSIKQFIGLRVYPPLRVARGCGCGSRKPRLFDRWHSLRPVAFRSGRARALSSKPAKSTCKGAGQFHKLRLLGLLSPRSIWLTIWDRDTPLTAWRPHQGSETPPFFVRARGLQAGGKLRQYSVWIIRHCRIKMGRSVPRCSNGRGAS